ncbi:uncharacterized protein M6D78_007436 [Vipera latastei]
MTNLASLGKSFATPPSLKKRKKTEGSSTEEVQEKNNRSEALSKDWGELPPGLYYIECSYFRSLGNIGDGWKEEEGEFYLVSVAKCIINPLIGKTTNTSHQGP